jgi:hypothetical protein
VLLAAVGVEFTVETARRRWGIKAATRLQIILLLVVGLQGKLSSPRLRLQLRMFG